MFELPCLLSFFGMQLLSHLKIVQLKAFLSIFAAACSSLLSCSPF